MLNKKLQLSVNNALNEAQSLGYEYLTIEHLLLSLIDDKVITKLLEDLGVEIADIYNTLSVYLDQNCSLNDCELNFTEIETMPTVAFQRVFERALFQAKAADKNEISAGDILLSILEENECYASYVLKQYGINKLVLSEYLTMSFSVKDSDELNPWGLGDEDNEQQDPISRFTTNLNDLAQSGKIDPLIGRENDIHRVMQVLCRRRKNNPILVGEAGVGKTAIAEGLAWLIVQNKVPEKLAKTTIFSLDISSLVAGATYRGDFENRFNELTQALEKKPDSILFIDEIHLIVGAGAAGESKMDTANLFKPLLSSGKIRVLGSTTYQEYTQVFSKDHALARRFQKIDIVEPSIEETIKILQGLKNYYETFHQVRYTSGALKSAVDLSVKYLPDRFLPDKAIDLIDEAGAKNALLPAKLRKKSIANADIEKIVAKIARIPEKTVSTTDKTKLQELDKQLKSVVFGQDKAIEVLCDAITLNRAGLGREHKPIGAFLFAGPTGVGKTEITVQLAKKLGIELLRFDMSEYKESHTISRLIGSPPGYVGFGQGGLLTEQIIKHPYAVLLLDEIEKAHADIFNLLLQIMDNGSLTDSTGRKADFRNIILVMTTNAGVQETIKSSIGFFQQDHSHDAMSEIKRFFSPEFRNRLDNIIWFEHLKPNVLIQIVDKFIAELQLQLSSKQIELEVSANAKKWLAENGYDNSMGARPMARLIQDKLKKPIANELLFGKLQHGGAIKVNIKNQKLSFDFVAKPIKVKA